MPTYRLPLHQDPLARAKSRLGMVKMLRPQGTATQQAMVAATTARILSGTCVDYATIDDIAKLRIRLDDARAKAYGFESARSDFGKYMQHLVGATVLPGVRAIATYGAEQYRDALLVQHFPAASMATSPQYGRFKKQLDKALGIRLVDKVFTNALRPKNKRVAATEAEANPV